MTKKIVSHSASEHKPPKFLKSRYYPVSIALRIIYNAPQKRAKDAEWKDPYRNANAIAIKGSRLNEWDKQFATFEIRSAPVEPTPTKHEPEPGDDDYEPTLEERILTVQSNLEHWQDEYDRRDDVFGQDYAQRNIRHLERVLNDLTKRQRAIDARALAAAPTDAPQPSPEVVPAVPNEPEQTSGAEPNVAADLLGMLRTTPGVTMDDASAVLSAVESVPAPTPQAEPSDDALSDDGLTPEETAAELAMYDEAPSAGRPLGSYRSAEASEPDPRGGALTDSERRTVEYIREGWNIIDRHDRELGLGESGSQQTVRQLLAIIDRLSGKAGK